MSPPMTRKAWTTRVSSAGANGAVVLDASVVLALLFGEPGAEAVHGHVHRTWATMAGAAGVDIQVIR